MTTTIFKTPSMIRQEWVEAVTVELRALLASHGYEVPANIRVSIGFPKGGAGGHSKAIGQCWYAASSSDKHHELFVSPELRETTRVMGVLAHELIHATLGGEAGHKAPFKRAAVAIGLCGKMTATEEGPSFLTWAEPVVARLGAYPAGSLAVGGRKKQSTRLVKCACEGCGYTVRTTRKWIEDAGTPICPTDETPMEVA